MESMGKGDWGKVQSGHHCYSAQVWLSLRPLHVQKGRRSAQTQGGVFSPLMSKGHLTETRACPAGGLVVLSGLNQFTSKQTQLTPSSGARTQANVL